MLPFFGKILATIRRESEVHKAATLGKNGMKPITDDIVKNLIDRLDAQKEDARPSVDPAACEAGSMTARILPFRQSEGGASETRHQSAAVLDLPRARRARASARTVSGMFIYTARL